MDQNLQALKVIEMVLLMAALAAMAKHNPKRRRRMGRYIRGNVNEDITFAGLTGVTLVAAAFDESVQERTFISSIIARYTMSNWTDIGNVGPILIGVAHNDYTAAEIEAFIEATGSWDEGNLTQQEIGKRKIRRIGIFKSPQSVDDNAVLNDGKPIKTKLNWILNQGTTLDLWVYNLGTGTVATSTPVCHVEGHVNLWPR